MSRILIMDKFLAGAARHRGTQSLEYRLPDDRLSFWTGEYPTAGEVLAFMCGGCGRIALYGGKSHPSMDPPKSSPRRLKSPPSDLGTDGGRPAFGPVPGCGSGIAHARAARRLRAQTPGPAGELK